MKYYTVYDSVTGEIRFSGSCSEGSFEYLEIPDGCSMLPELHNPKTGYIYSGAYFEFPPSPSEFHKWNWDKHTWAIPSERTEEIKNSLYKRIEAIRDSKKNEPISFNGILFDADEVSVANMRETSDRIRRGDGLPIGWIGWRTYDNSIVWDTSTEAEVLDNLTVIRRDLEDRWQSILKASWFHKDHIKALTSISALMSYDCNTGW